MAELYQLTFPDGKVYVGITKSTAAKRFARHRYNAKQVGVPKYDTPKYRAWRALGEPTMEVLASGDLATMARLETALITDRDLMATGYNSAAGGGGVGKIF